MDTSQSLFQILLYTIPTVMVVATVALFLALRLYRKGKDFESYKNDQFRLSIEKQIAELNQQLMYSESRFRELNHLLIDAQKAYKGPLKEQSKKKVNFFKELGINTDDPIDERSVFVLAPFHPDSQEIYDSIRQVSEQLRLKCSRGDEEYRSSNILSHILSQIVRARLVIADVTGRNPNVFYELGIAHALGKPVLIIGHSMQDVPFDLSTIRVLLYSDFKSFQQRLETWLIESLLDVQS